MKRKILWCVALTVALAACGEKKAASGNVEGENGLESYDLGSADPLILPANPAEERLADGADELFDDFIFEFSRLRKLQRERISFPLLSVVRGDTSVIEKEQWTYDPVFTNEDYYTVFYNDEEQMELEKSTDLDHVDVEQVNLTQRWIKTSYFERSQGKWRLVKEDVRDFNTDNLYDNFLDFYAKFVSDMDFQKRSVAATMKYITTDPDDDFSTIEGAWNYDDWDAFKPQLPDSIITNIRYGQTYDASNNMIMVKAGISNGLMDILSFAKKQGTWKLVSYEN